MSFLQQILYFPPPPSPYITAMTTISFVSLTYCGLSELRGKHLQYSKFWKKGKEGFKLSSRAGMLLLYTPAFLAGAASLAFSIPSSLRFSLLASSLTIHFLKRVIEVLFVHKYSGGMTLDFSIPISLGYFSATLNALYAQYLTEGIPEPQIDLKYAGVVLFLVGIAGVRQTSSVLQVLERKGKDSFKLSSHAGMLLLYTPTFLAGMASLAFSIPSSLRFLLLCSSLTIHFLKRVIVVLFVHKYSGGMTLESAIPISSSYFSATVNALYAQYLTEGIPEPQIDLKYAGAVLFLVGIAGNFYHHYLLSKLREKDDKGYKIPRGGLFSLVICPHYLFEIVGFIGISCISQTVYASAFTLGTICYLMGRSYATRKWYCTKFSNFPNEVKALIPFVF